MKDSIEIAPNSPLNEFMNSLTFIWNTNNASHVGHLYGLERDVKTISKYLFPHQLQIYQVMN